ncbi:MAG: phenylacetaldoxime dehydratase [Pseudonocardia sp. SCN 72-86]|nr:MAG: phenylacetaldoxime dehydratase [Pseudonocardia sp. SCN 72-86]
MESAIPGHLTVERTRPRRIPDDYQPPYPAFVARSRPEVQRVVMAYFGLQFGDADPAAALAALDDAFGGTDGPGHHERTRHVDESVHEIVCIAYWDEPETFDRWFADHRETWVGDSAAADGLGRWIEVIRPAAEEYETLFSSLGRPEGIAVVADGFSADIQEHGYWGGMRDRIPLSQHDAMPPVGEPVVERDGARVRVRPAGGLCLIRSGQDYADTEGDERAMYLGDVEPPLRTGMDFLRADGGAVGCYANRYLTVLDADGATTDRTFGMSWWRSLDKLERWAESHPTHVAIFGAAMKYLSTMGPAAKLRLYHEVSVVPADGQHFEYVNCDERTGLLGAL